MQAMNYGLLAAAFLLLGGCAGPRAAAGKGEAAVPEKTGEVVAVVDAFQAALRAGDIDRAAGFLDPGVVILESGGAEHSRDEYLAVHAPADAQFLKSVKITPGQRTTRIEGIKGRNATETPIVYRYEGDDDKHYDQEAATFVKSVLGEGTGEDKYRNDTAYGVESTFMAILGREAAYKRQTLTWDELWNSNQRLTFGG
jgi:hypothetical protein